MLKFFKIVALLEGISLLLLFFVAMPMKYIWGNKEMVAKVGMAHGLLFILYIIVAFLVKEERRWNSKQFAIVCLASVLPMGTFYIDWKYLKRTN